MGLLVLLRKKMSYISTKKFYLDFGSIRFWVGILIMLIPLSAFPFAVISLFNKNILTTHLETACLMFFSLIGLFCYIQFISLELLRRLEESMSYVGLVSSDLDGCAIVCSIKGIRIIATSKIKSITGNKNMIMVIDSTGKEVNIKLPFWLSSTKTVKAVRSHFMIGTI